MKWDSLLSGVGIGMEIMFLLIFMFGEFNIGPYVLSKGWTKWAAIIILVYSIVHNILKFK
ncbi:hypothetical protein TY91_15865 [Secundilactobacillus collinoides]|uniref:Uncharacterized protein n=1 Tax=Secundilactobacillus collinoides TaxID=33960 RepID=A0A161XQX8_SECCO|nr:hypothetical protein TY91_15865 [Secundilactobacillus collinoides]